MDGLAADRHELMQVSVSTKQGDNVILARGSGGAQGAMGVWLGG